MLVMSLSGSMQLRGVVKEVSRPQLCAVDKSLLPNPSAFLASASHARKLCTKHMKPGLGNRQGLL